MFKKVLKDKLTDSRLYNRRKLYALLLIPSLSALLLCVCFMLQETADAQKNDVLGHAGVYASILDHRIAALEPDLSPDAANPAISLESLLADMESMEFPIASPTAAFCVIKDGRVLLTKGHSILSHKLVAAISELAKSNFSELSVYTYRDSVLPDLYFYVLTSPENGLDYCYYEPALTGWRLFRAGIATGWGILLAALLLVSIFLFSLLAASTPPRKVDNDRVVEITAPEAPAEEAAFGSLPYFSGIIIDYHSTSGRSVSPETLRLFDEIIRENLIVNKILYQVSAQGGSDCLQYYMNYINYNLRVLSDSLKMNLFNAAPDYDINIFYSTAVLTRQEMENELLYLHQNLRYSLIMGYGIRFSIEQIRAFEASSAVLDANVANTIQNHLRTRAYEDLYNYLRCYQEALTHYRRSGSVQYSFAEVYRFAEEAFSAVKSFFRENSFSHPLVQTTCSTILRTTPGLRAFCQYLISCIQDFQQENQHVLSTRNEQIMNSIYMYIEQDLAGANLNSIARKMQMTDSHLSRVFKKNTGSNFSEYLSERKLEEAARLLVQDQKMKVADISDLLGYGNPTYFLSRFKAKYGVSPSAYRREHLTDSEIGSVQPQ